MKGNQSPITQIIVGVTVPVLTAWCLWYFGLNEKGEPTNGGGQQTVVSPENPGGNDRNGSDADEDDDQRIRILGPVQERPRQPDPEPQYITATVLDRLAIDQMGFGQISDQVTITIGGSTQSIQLSALTGINRGSTKLRLPGAGSYNFVIQASTIFNNHHYYGQPCTHYGYGAGTIYIEDGDVLEVMMDASTINNTQYTAFLQKS